MRIPCRSRRLRRGASLVEFAFVFPVLLTLILGMVEMARLGLVLQLLTSAAREGCRVAVVYGRTQADVQARVNSILHGSGINVGTVNPTPSTWETAPVGMPITVRLSVPYRQVTWLPVPKFLGNLNVTATATLSSERP
jgi:Flp pilus assembly protein TadG